MPNYNVAVAPAQINSPRSSNFTTAGARTVAQRPTTGQLWPPQGPLKGDVGAQGPQGPQGPALTIPRLATVMASLLPANWYKMDDLSAATVVADSGSAPIAGAYVTANKRISRAVDKRSFSAEAVVGQGAALATFGNNFGFAGNLPFTIVLFHFPYAYGTQTRRVLQKNDTTSGPLIFITGVGALLVGRYGGGGSLYVGGTATVLASAVALQQWNMYAMTYDGATLGGYLNGELTTLADAGAMAASTAAFRLHGEPTNTAGWGADGRYSNLAIWPRALTKVDLDSLYDCVV